MRRRGRQRRRLGALAALAEALDAPVCTTVSGRSALADSHPLHVGVDGANGGLPGTKAVLAQAGRHFITNRAHGALGYALSAGFGAAIARPDATVVAVMGDGSFGFTCGELETVVRIGSSRSRGPRSAGFNVARPVLARPACPGARGRATITPCSHRPGPAWRRRGSGGT